MNERMVQQVYDAQKTSERLDMELVSIDFEDNSAVMRYKNGQVVTFLWSYSDEYDTFGWQVV